jgi:hypothetical protein
MAIAMLSSVSAQGLKVAVGKYSLMGVAINQ